MHSMLSRGKKVCKKHTFTHIRVWFRQLLKAPMEDRSDEVSLVLLRIIRYSEDKEQLQNSNGRPQGATLLYTGV